MDDRFSVLDDNTVVERDLAPRYNDNTPILIGDVVFDIPQPGNIYGPYIVKNIGQTSIGVIVSLDPMPIIGPTRGTALESVKTLQKVTEADIKLIEAKWASNNAIAKAKELQNDGNRLARVWHSRGYELFVIHTGGVPITRIPIKTLSKRINASYDILDWHDITDITEETEILKNISERDIPKTIACDVSDLILDDKETVDIISAYLETEYEIPRQVIDTLCQAYTTLNH